MYTGFSSAARAIQLMYIYEHGQTGGPHEGSQSDVWWSREREASIPQPTSSNSPSAHQLESF